MPKSENLNMEKKYAQLCGTVSWTWSVYLIYTMGSALILWRMLVFYFNMSCLSPNHKLHFAFSLSLSSVLSLFAAWLGSTLHMCGSGLVWDLYRFYFRLRESSLYFFFLVFLSHPNSRPQTNCLSAVRRDSLNWLERLRSRYWKCTNKPLVPLL